MVASVEGVAKALKKTRNRTAVLAATIFFQPVRADNMSRPGDAHGTSSRKCTAVRQQLVGARPHRTGGNTCTHVGSSREKSNCCFVAQVRQRLKADNYKAGRISQLLKATRPIPEQQTTDMSVTGLPRLFEKQVPARGWEGVAVPPWVQRALVAGTAATPVRGKESAECLPFLL